jgi:hypothetical protein
MAGCNALLRFVRPLPVFSGALHPPLKRRICYELLPVCAIDSVDSLVECMFPPATKGESFRRWVYTVFRDILAALQARTIFGFRRSAESSGSRHGNALGCDFDERLDMARNLFK